ncbi:MAG: hypothetical protein H7Y86_11435 [Rhizobacter sp.]|nr:hypothetical protein [Ferruginibacter sp.]
MSKNGKDTLPFEPERDWLKNNGKFKITYTEEDYIIKNVDSIGNIQFLRVLYDSDKAMVQTYIRDNSKHGIVYLNLLKKIKGKWHLIKKILMSVT